MRIISMKNGFTSDHSSTSYEFLAVNKPLDKKERTAVAALSKRANPTSRKVSFSYHVDGYDIPGGWVKLMEQYYDVMYREEYDWWTLAVAFDSSEEQIDELLKYEFTGEDDLGIDVFECKSRVIVVINCRLAALSTDESYDDYEADEEDEEGEASDMDRVVSEDALLTLLVQLREQLKQRDYRTLYVVWEKYGFSYEDDEEDEEREAPPIPPEKSQGENVVEHLCNILE